MIHGEDIEKDPGTYLYTAIPRSRNEFRSTKSHNIPIIQDEEQNRWEKGRLGLFHLHSDSKCSVIEYDRHYIEFLLEYRNTIIVRKFEITENFLTITDSCNKEFYYKKNKYYSNGYGKLLKNKR